MSFIYLANNFDRFCAWRELGAFHFKSQRGTTLDQPLIRAAAGLAVARALMVVVTAGKDRRNFKSARRPPGVAASPDKVPGSIALKIGRGI